MLFSGVFVGKLHKYNNISQNTNLSQSSSYYFVLNGTYYTYECVDLTDFGVASRYDEQTLTKVQGLVEL